VSNWLVVLLYAAGFVVVAWLVLRDERRDRLAWLADPTPTNEELLRERLADTEALIRATRERDPNPDIAQWQDELDEAAGK
jgi:hypothetical protein